jgi:hypothetical protein
LYLEVARKAAKSTLMAAIALYHLLRKNEPGASVVCGATTGPAGADGLRDHAEDGPAVGLAARAGD